MFNIFYMTCEKNINSSKKDVPFISHDFNKKSILYNLSSECYSKISKSPGDGIEIPCSILKKTIFINKRRKKNLFQRVLSDKSFNVGAKNHFRRVHCITFYLFFLLLMKRDHIYKSYSTPLLLSLVSLFFF
jgi:hypothetical protein